MKSKYETHVLPYLDKIDKWVRKGASQKEIAKNLHIAESSLKLYLRKGNEGDPAFTPLSDAFARACEEPDDNVEAALYKSAIGYTVTIQKTFKIKISEFDPVTGRKIAEHEELVKGEDEQHIPANVEAQKFWLANRRRSVWSYKPEGPDKTSDGEDRGVIMIPQVSQPEEEEKP